MTGEPVVVADEHEGKLIHLCCSTALKNLGGGRRTTPLADTPLTDGPHTLCLSVEGGWDLEWEGWGGHL
ncbi:hypothetical protein UPYG_G00051920 [Umbra pygmaea]|uniref:Uncharacterized protein n=1 Tax=Umbra pygmaea TaxID=75934 RepID=A0ABD0XPD2_UMBPY